MKILYKQSQTGSVFENCGIKQCYFKHLKNDSKSVTKKLHHHTGFEIHIPISGYQAYEINGERYTVKEGHFILIPPKLNHRAEEYITRKSKFSLTFSIDENSPLHAMLQIKDCVVSVVTERITDNIRRITEENSYGRMFSPVLTEYLVYETVLLILRQCGLREAPAPRTDINDDARITMAKQYINDNVEQALKVTDIATYCYLSTKQLTRLFNKAVGMSPAAYITKKKIAHIERLLDNDSLSLRDISEIMNFSSEYHFNSFFKKYAGMPPGEYRKMVK